MAAYSHFQDAKSAIKNLTRTCAGQILGIQRAKPWISLGHRERSYTKAALSQSAIGGTKAVADDVCLLRDRIGLALLPWLRYRAARAAHVQAADLMTGFGLLLPSSRLRPSIVTLQTVPMMEFVHRRLLSIRT